MALLVLPRMAVPVWIVVVGLAAAFQPQGTMTANILLLGIVGIVIPVIWLLVMSRWRRAHSGAVPAAEK